MTFKHSSYSIISILLFVTNVYATEPSSKVSGQIIDEFQSPVAYAHIGIIGETNGTITDENGRFSIDISGMTPEDSLFISSVGYHTKKIGFSEVSAIKEITITLKTKSYSTEEAIITAKKSKLVTFGRNKPGGNSGWNFSGIATGNEAGMTFKNNQGVYISEFRFHVSATNFDSLLYRINVYEIVENELTHINREDILIVSDITNGWIQINLDDHLITTDQDFAVTVEVLTGWKSGKKTNRGKVVFTGKNTLSKTMLQRSNQFMPIEHIGLKLNMTVTAYQ